MRRALASLILLIAGCGTSTSRNYVPPGGGGGNDQGISFADVDLGTRACDPNEAPTCDGQSVVRACRADGSGYDSTPCPDGALCMAGQCSCTPGDRTCSGSDVMVCDAGGMFQVEKTCGAGSVCANGYCTDARCADESMSSNPNALPTNAWPRFRHDNRNTGVTQTKVAAMPKMKWKTFIGGSSYGGRLSAMTSGAVVNQNNVLFVGAGDADGKMGSFYSLDAKGNKLWTFAAQRGLGLSTAAVRADGSSYFAASTQTLWAVDPKGAKLWSYAVGSVADSNPIVTKDGILIYSSDDGSVYALDPMGKLVWKSDPATGPGEVDGGLAESCDGKIYAGGAHGWTQLDEKTGKTLWQVKPHGAYPAMVCSSPLVTADGTMYGWEIDGTGSAIDATGKVLWTRTWGTKAGAAPTKIGNTLYVVLNDGALHAVDATNGKDVWQKPVGDGNSVFLLAGPVVDGNQRIYFNSQDGFVYCFDANGNQIWRIAASGQGNSGYSWAGDIAIGNDGTMYVPGNDGNLYAFQ